MFWRLTLREMHVILKGCGERLDREHNANAWLAWHVAALQRAKKFPPLKEMQIRKHRRVRQKTPDEMIAIAHLWTMATKH